MGKGQEDAGGLLAASAGFLPAEGSAEVTGAWPLWARAWEAPWRGRIGGTGSARSHGRGRDGPPTKPRPATFTRGSARLTDP